MVSLTSGCNTIRALGNQEKTPRGARICQGQDPKHRSRPAETS